ncbi:MAG TPA: ATP-binding protein [Chthoniobacterales bacterium]|jgi:two-component system phosphate regulon sensor histidine kinase PhoR
MTWLLFGALAGLVLVLFLVWQKWVAPWRQVEEMVVRVARGEKPPTFLLQGGLRPRKVALALESVLQRQTRLEQQIAERASGSDTIFAALQDGLLVVDPRHHLTFVNRSFRELFSSRPDDLGRPVLEVIRDPVVDQLIAETLARGEPQRAEMIVPATGSHSLRQMLVSAVAIQGDAGLTTGAMVLFHDITQLKQVDELRRDFVANVSHELRTPLSILRGYIETMLEDPETSREELTRMLEVMNRHSRRLGLLVDDLLTLAQFESGNPHLQLSQVRLTELFAAIVRDWARKFSEKKLRVHVGTPSDLPPIRADETRLQEVLYNLLDNALKYTEPGGAIHLQAEKRADEVVISVGDTGVGIPETDLPRIFERFYRTDKARSRALGGTGLGLAIVKHIAQMHGGRVEAESVLQEGTTIRVFMPIAGPSEPVVT